MTSGPFTSIAARVLARPLTWFGLGALLAGVEFVTPSALLISVLFPVPVALAAWHRRVWWTVALVLGMTGVALADELSAAEMWSVGAAAANAVARLVAFSGIALITANAARLRGELADPNLRSDRGGTVLPAALRSPVSWVALTAMLLGANYLTGPEVLISVLFLFPVALAAWHRRPAWALGLAGVLVVGRLGIELAGGGSWLPWSDFVNAGLRFLVLGLIAFVADLAAFWYQEASDRAWGSDEDSAYSGVGPAPRPARRWPGIAGACEAVAAAGISATLIWDFVKTFAFSGRKSVVKDAAAPDRRRNTGL